MRLTTERLILREPTIKDAKDIVRNINNLKVSGNLLRVPYPYNLKNAKWFINHCKEESKKKPRTTYSFSIELKSEKKIIGGIGLDDVNKEQGTAEIGYWLGENYWRQGIIREAATKMINFAFNKLKLRRLEAYVYKENGASQELAKSLGFKYEGCRRKAVKSKADGKIHDDCIHGLLEEDWKK